MGGNPLMAYNVANNLRVAMPDPIGVDQLKRKNVLADTAMQADQQRNALYGQQIAQNDSRMKADEQSQALERVRQWAPGAIAQARAGQIAPFVQAGQQLGVIDPNRDPATVTADEVEEFATQLGIGPAQQAVPFDQTPDALKLKMQGDQAMALERARAGSAMALERTRQSAPQRPDAPKGSKWERTTINLPDGRTLQGVVDMNSSNPSMTFRPLGAPAAAAESAASAKKSEAEIAKEQAFNLYETARDGLLNGLAGSVTGPVAGRIPAVTTEQQVAEGGVSAMAPVLKQLFRVAGEGTFTDRDQDLLMKMVPTRTDNAPARIAKTRNIDNIVRAKLGMPPAPADVGDVPDDIKSILQKHGRK